MRLSEEEYQQLRMKRKAQFVYDGTKARVQALGRLKSGQMNKTEAEYAEHLEALKHAGEILWWKFEGVKFKLAENTHYSPDFAVMLKTGEIEIREIKGHWEEDAKVKIKVAAAMYPFRFVALKKKPKKDGGGWSVEEF